MTKPNRFPSLNADDLGIFASALCFVHCVLTPAILSFSAVWAHYLPSEEGTHRTLALLVAAVGGIAIGTGFRRHRRVRVVVLMISGLLCIVFGAYFGTACRPMWRKLR